MKKYNILCFCMSENMWFEICWLCKLLVATIKWTNIRPITGVNSDMCSKVEVQGEPFTTSFKCTLQRHKTHPKFTEFLIPHHIKQTSYVDLALYPTKTCSISLLVQYQTDYIYTLSQLLLLQSQTVNLFTHYSSYSISRKWIHLHTILIVTPLPDS